MNGRLKFILLGFLVILIVLFPHAQRPSNKIGMENATHMETQGYGDIISDPYRLDLDTYYGENWTDFWVDNDIRYLSVLLETNEIYYIYYESAMFWDLELYYDPLYEYLLGTPYTVPGGKILREYLTFSPNSSGYYYIKLYQSGGINTLRIAVLQAEEYTINTTELVLISDPTHPIHVFQADLPEGNYTCSHDTLYAKVERGWNYAVLDVSYGTLPDNDLFIIQNGSYALIIEESCQFTLTCYLPANESPPEEPPDDPGDNSTDDVSNTGVFDNMTPIFGVGVILGILVICKIKSKKK